MKNDTAVTSRKRLWTGRFLSGLAVVFLLFDGITKVAQVDAVVKASAQAGYTADVISTVGIILLACTALYIIPPTSIFGALLLTAYLGGAVATNLRVGMPLFTNILFPVYFALVVWGGLYLRNPNIRILIPFQKGE